MALVVLGVARVPMEGSVLGTVVRILTTAGTARWQAGTEKSAVRAKRTTPRVLLIDRLAARLPCWMVNLAQYSLGARSHVNRPLITLITHITSS